MLDFGFGIVAQGDGNDIESSRSILHLFRGQKHPGGTGQATLLFGVDVSFRVGFCGRGSRLDFDEYHGVAVLGDEVHFPGWAFVVTGQNSVAGFFERALRKPLAPGSKLHAGSPATWTAFMLSGGALAAGVLWLLSLCLP